MARRIRFNYQISEWLIQCPTRVKFGPEFLKALLYKRGCEEILTIIKEVPFRYRKILTMGLEVKEASGFLRSYFNFRLKIVATTFLITVAENALISSLENNATTHEHTTPLATIII